jgi:diguanylate cyclase (GGDEF)-like protein
VSGRIAGKGMIKKFRMLKALEARSRPFWIITSLLLVVVLGILDYLTGNEYSFSLFYLIPISLIAWYVNRPTGIFISILIAVTWLVADLILGADYSHPIIYIWNTMIRFGFFIISTYLISELHISHQTIQALARTDYITGLFNSRYFHELLESELRRSSRYKRSFTLVYLDLDNFKEVNDRLGHEEGDILLRLVANGLKPQLRHTDIAARLGGDEFAILFPETGQQEAESVMAKIYNHVNDQLRPKYPFTTFSAGAVTYVAIPNSSAETIKLADELMYSVKNSTKNGIRYLLYTG